MKKLKRALALLVAGASLFSLTACFGGGGEPGNKDSNVTYGRYVEEDLTPDGMGGYSRAFYSNGNVLDIVTNTWDRDTYLTTYARWRSEDGGESWITLPMDWVKDYQTDYTQYEDDEWPDHEFELSGMTILDNGELLFVVQEYDNLKGTSTCQAKIADMQGNIRDYDFAPADILKEPGRGGNLYFNSLGNGRVYMELYSYLASDYEGGGIVDGGEMPEVDPDGIVPFGDDLDTDTGGDEGEDETQDDSSEARQDTKGGATAEAMPAIATLAEDAVVSISAPVGYDEQVIELRGVYDLATGQQIVDMVALGTYSYAYNDSALVYLDESSNQLKAVSLDTGAPLDVELPTYEEMYLEKVYFYNSFLTDDFTFYYMSNDGTRLYKQGMEEAEEIMEGINYLYGSPVAWPDSPTMDEEGNILCAVNYDDNVRIMRYHYDPDMPATSDQHIKVYSLYNDDSARMALSEFKRARPEITVSYEYALDRWSMHFGEEGESSMTEDDALRALNIELLAGRGPDVLILDDLPLQSYMERGMLEDISGVLEGRNLINEVIEPFKNGDKLYAVPTRFTMPLLFGENGYAQQFTTLEEIVKAAEEAPGYPPEPDYDNFTEEDWNNYYNEQNGPKAREDQPLLQIYELDSLVGALFELSQPDIYTEKDGINEANLRTLLEYTKRLSDKYGLTEKEIWAETGRDSYVLGIAGSTLSSLGFYEYVYNQARLGLYELDDFYPIIQLPIWEYHGSFNHIYDEETEEWVQTEYENWSFKDTATLLAPGISGVGTYRPYAIAGVVANSGQKSLATEFVGTMLNEDLQSLSRQSYLPVNRDSFEHRMETTIKDSSSELREYDVKALEVDFDSLFSQLERPVFTNLYLQQIIYDYTLPYCRGEISLDEAVGNIVSETKIYFNEREQN